MARVGFDPSVVSDTTALWALGQVLEYSGAQYAYYLNGDTATATGDVMRVTATTSTANGATAPTITNRSAGVGGGAPAALTDNQMMGVAVGVVGAGKYGFFLVLGYHSAVKVDAATAGDLIKPSTATNARGVVCSAATHRGGAIALANAAGNLSACWVNV